MTPTSEPGDENVVKFDAATVAAKKRKKCDEIFAEYLATVAKVVKKDCYNDVLTLVFLFRECLNRFGKRLPDSKATTPAPVPTPVATTTTTTATTTATAGIPPSDPEGPEDYCLTNNAEQAPELSNQFVTEYVEQVKPGFDRTLTIEFTQNLCSWLFNNGYTCSRLSLINDSSQ